MRILLICHQGALLDQDVLARWLASFSDLAGLVVVEEPSQRVWRRIRREIKRVGFLRFLDVIAFRAYYRLFLAANDQSWERRTLDQLRATYPEIPPATPILRTSSPNTPEAQRFITGLRPDLVIARCKSLLKDTIFSIPPKGTFVMHPGVCPEYRNAHGCFWALANDDLTKVGMTLLRIDKGVDTGPTFGYYSYPYDERNESHIVIQHRVVLDNLPALQAKLTEIYTGSALPLDVSGRSSAAWGQPWLTSYLRWKFRARNRKRAT